MLILFSFLFFFGLDVIFFFFLDMIFTFIINLGHFLGFNWASFLTRLYV